MSPLSRLSVLALASTVFAVPHAHQHSHHSKMHSASNSLVSSKLNATGTASKPASWSSTPAKTSTRLHTSTTTVCVTLTETVTPVAPVSVASATDSVCPTGSTVTTTTQTTVYVTVGESEIATSSNAPWTASSEASAGTSSEAWSTPSSAWVAPTSATVAPATTGSSSAWVEPTPSSSTWVAPASSSSWVAPSSSSSSTWVAPSSSAPAVTPSSVAEVTPYAAPTSASPVAATSSAAAIVASIASIATSEAGKAASPVIPSSSTAAPAATSSAASSGSGKRGLAYNDVGLTSAFTSSPHVSWAYNWGSATSALDSSIEYIPLLWGSSSTFTDVWSENAKKAIANGSTKLFAFNEPDDSTQANMSPAAAAAAWKTYMEPFAGQAKLCSPSVTNGGGQMGLTWLSNFLDACTGCTIDCLSIHWYNPASLASDLKNHVSQAITLGGGKPVYVSEFGATGSDAEVSSFLEEVMPWMDSQSGVEGYAYFMVSDGLLVSGDAPSTYGLTYANFS